jgi:hypothetical protein
MSRAGAMAGVFVAAGVAVGMALSGCAGESTTGDATPTDTPASTATLVEETSAPTSNQSAPGDTTAPGTELGIGDTAVVPYKYGTGAVHTVAITVTAIEKGDKAAFERQFGAKAADLTPYYLRVTARNVGDTDMSYASSPRVRAITADGGLTGVSLVGDLGDCVNENFAKDAGKDATLESCFLEAAQPGDEVTGVQYGEDEGGYRDQPIVWRR